MKTVEELEAQVGALEAENAELKKELKAARASGIPEELEEAVKEKIAAGLSRDQALAAAQAQADWDKEQAKAKRKGKE